jgi:hypothetical protein
VVERTMDPLAWLRKQLEEPDVDLLREMLRTFIQALMAAEADALCGAPYGERSPERVNQGDPWPGHLHHRRRSGVDSVPPWPGRSGAHRRGPGDLR